jgi:hypothetical protein
MIRQLAPMLAAGAGSLLLKPSFEVGEALSRGSAPGVWRWERLTRSAWGKLAFGMVSVALMAGAFYLGSITSQPAKPISAAIPEVVSAPLPVEAELIGVDQGRDAEPAPGPVPVIAAPARASKPPPAGAPRGADGLTILGEVELALRQRNPKGALARLGELGKPESARIERLSRVLRAIALCDAGRRDEGRALVGQMRGERGSSVFAARLATACGSPSEAATVAPSAEPGNSH